MIANSETKTDVPPIRDRDPPITPAIEYQLGHTSAMTLATPFDCSRYVANANITRKRFYKTIV
jgi:hypothetical protein